MTHPVNKLALVGLLVACLLYASIDEDNTAWASDSDRTVITIPLEALPRVIHFFETCYLRDEPPERDREIQHFTANSSDASVKIKAHLIRLPEKDKPIQYLPLEFWFLMNVPLSSDSQLLALFGKCFSLMINVDKVDKYHFVRHKGKEYFDEIGEFIQGNSNLYEVTRITFNNENKSGHCEVEAPGLGPFKASDEYMSCPREQVFSCRRTGLTDGDKLDKPNKFDLLVIEHLEFGFDSYGKPAVGDQFAKKAKTCALE